jgi:stage II sporulation protein D
VRKLTPLFLGGQVRSIKTGSAFLVLMFFLSFSLANLAAQDVPAVYNNGEFNNTIRLYKKLAESKKEPKAYLNLAVILKDLGYHRQAIKVLRRSISKFGDDLKALSLLARLYYLSSRPDEAIAILNRIAAVKPRDPDTLLALALCYQDKGDDTEAQKYLEKIIALDKDNLLAHLSLADLYLRHDKLPESAEEYKKVSLLDASIQSIYKYWGLVLLKTGNLKEAFKVFEKISFMQPDNRFAKAKVEEIRLLLGREFFQKERQKRIKDKAEKMVLVKPAKAVKNMVFIKVGLMQAVSGIELKSSRGFKIKKKSGDIILAQGASGENCLIAKDADNLAVSLKDKEKFTVNEAIIISPLNQEGTITLFNVKYGKDNFWSSWQDRSYRGEIEISLTAKGINLVNKVNLEEYLYGVVPAEMPASWPTEALKAQAVAARSEAMAKLGRHKDEGFDFCAEVHCQAYNGVESETEATNQAVDDTKGELLYYADKPADAVYSSNCGGHTQDNIFGQEEEVAYLKGIPDTGDVIGMSFPLSPLELESWFKIPPAEIFCNIAEYQPRSNFRWVRIYSGDEIEEMLRGTADVGKINKIVVLKRRKSGHVSAIKIIGDKSSYVIEKELVIRKALGNLRSSMFKIEIKYASDQKPRQFVFYGGGFGHGLGLCQAGACGMAAQGRGYQEIISHYFSGVVLKKAY